MTKTAAMTVIVLLIVPLMMIGGRHARAEIGQVDPDKATTLNYEVDAALIFADELRRPGQAFVSSPLLASELKPSRSLGLRRMRFVADWQTAGGTALRVVLRPDAVNRMAEADALGEVREVDTRAGSQGDLDTGGSLYRPMPTIRLLDAYQIDVARKEALSASFGVFEEIAIPYVSYPEMLGFSLETRLPAKYAGVQLRWRPGGMPTAAAPDGGSLQMDLQVIQGNEDRVERVCGSGGDKTACTGAASSGDRAPLARDPYQGLAAGVRWTPSSKFEMAFLAGVFDAAEPRGRRNEIFAQSGMALSPTLWGHATKLSLDLRYVKERWRIEDTSVRPRVQYSGKLSAAYAGSSHLYWLAGVALGHSDREPFKRPLTDHVPADGYQIETGVLGVLGKGLHLQFMLVHESSESKDSDGRIGGISTLEGNRRTLRRAGIQMTYLLNENA